MAWIESHDTLRDHPKLDVLGEELFDDDSIPADLVDFAAVGILHHLWWWGLDYAEDGDLSAYSDRQVAKGCRWSGDAHRLMDALTAAGFVDSERRIHNWHDYAGKLIERRQRNRDRMREARRTSPELCNAHAEHVPDPCGATVPNPTVPSLTKSEDTRAAGDDSDFLEFWSAYPRNERRAEVARRFQRLPVSDRRAAIRGARHVAECVRAGTRALKYVPMPSTFIGPQRVFEDWGDGPPAADRPDANTGRRAGMTAAEIAGYFIDEDNPNEGTE